MKLAINGFGRIGRQSFKAMIENYPNVIDVVAINDLVSQEVNAHLLKYDSIHGRFGQDVDYDDENLTVGGKKIRAMAERDPERKQLIYFADPMCSWCWGFSPTPGCSKHTGRTSTT